MSQHQDVQTYYGETLSKSEDLKTDACCPTEAMPDRLKPILKDIHPEILERFYGCGSPLPLALEGQKVLDLGCGTGRDCYILSKLVGESGQVIGIDMTDEQLDMAKKHLDYHSQKFGYSNVSFHKGFIEDLSALGIQDESVNVISSNCVLNLSPNKKQVFQEIFRVLKPGGELYFSDVYADRRLPESLSKDPEVLGECLGGALYIEDFRRILSAAGCRDYRIVSQSPLSIKDASIKERIGQAQFYSMTIRAFKLNLEDRHEDYGQTATYKGSIKEAPKTFVLDEHHSFESGKPVPICKNTADILELSRFAKHFEIISESQTHRGLFNHKTQIAPSLKSSGACC